MKKIFSLLICIFFSINPLFAINEDIIFSPDKILQKEKVNVSIVLNSYNDYETIKERIENLTDEVNGNLSIKMI